MEHNEKTSKHKILRSSKQNIKNHNSKFETFKKKKSTQVHRLQLKISNYNKKDGYYDDRGGK